MSWLTEELISLGKKVTLFASGGSTSGAELVLVSPKPLRLSRPPIDPMSALAALLESVAKRANEFDVIHCHLDWVHIPFFLQLGRRMGALIFRFALFREWLCGCAPWL